ncbi:MAG: PadR family transcriptional regulator [Gemmatimonadota bacterium]
MSRESLELMQGTLDVLVLRTLAWGPNHGYGISKWIRDRTEGALEVQDAALYQALRRMEARGWIEAEWGLSETNRRARYYSLTAQGRLQLRTEASTWRRYVEAVFKVLDPTPGEAP